MSATEIETLKNRIIGILRSDACKRINFQANNIKVRGAGFSRVVDLIGTPVSNGITIEINPDVAKKKGFEAAYNAGAKVFVFKSANVGANGRAAAYEKSLIVHEATHALVDNTLEVSIDHLSSEIVAYIAGLTFYKLAGGSMKFTNKIWVEAGKLAVNVAGAGAGGYNFQPGELSKLTAAIKGQYSDADTELPVEKTREGDIIEPIGRWKVKCGGTREAPKWLWYYDFKDGGSVNWVDAFDADNGGSGTWSLSRVEVRLTTRWKSGTTETWLPPFMTSGGLSGDFMSGKTRLSGKNYDLWADRV